MAKKSRFGELLAVEVAGGSTIREAAAAVGCSESVAYHLSSTPEFRQRVNEIRSEITAGAVGSLTAGARQAVETLRVLLSSSEEPSIRLQAAKAILSLVGPLSELGELRQRLDSLEAANNQLRVAR